MNRKSCIETERFLSSPKIPDEPKNDVIWMPTPPVNDHQPNHRTPPGVTAPGVGRGWRMDDHGDSPEVRGLTPSGSPGRIAPRDFYAAEFVRSVGASAFLNSHRLYRELAGIQITSFFGSSGILGEDRNLSVSMQDLRFIPQNDPTQQSKVGGPLACYLYTTFANSRGPRHEICAREIGSFELPVFQEHEDVRGNRGRVARD